jgi:hypothetical protein
MGRLERQLDLDLLARLKAGIKHPPKPLKRAKPPRPWWTYRAAWRNLHRRDARG